MKLNWIAPNEVGDTTFDPKCGDTTPIDFDLAASTFYDVGGLTGERPIHDSGHETPDVVEQFRRMAALEAR